MDEYMYLLLLLLLVIFLLLMFRNMRARQAGSSGQATQAQTARTEKGKIVEDIKATRTSRVADAVSILEELESTSPGYRQYCELIGTAQHTSSVIAPYSKREVAYYDLRAFRIENIGGREVETLIAHERSIDPFFFMDNSCDTPIYVDLDSFGDNIILVNAANRIEGPGSQFAQAISAASKGGGAGSSYSYAIVGELRDKAHGLASTLRERLSWRPALQPALAFAGPDTCGESFGSFASAPVKRYEPSGNVAFARGMGIPGMGYGNIPGGLGDFMGGNYGNIGGPHGGHWRGSGTDAGTVLLGLGLGALIGSLTDMGQQESSREPVTPQSQFRGYRIVEDIVPLGSQIYALGEIYRNGDAIHMGRSVSTTYPSSYFATKPEAEVIAHLNKK